jgi:uroporphyrinogen decarboxylase
MGADVIGLDWRLDLEAARARVGAGVALQGNLDPSVLLGPRRFIRQRTLDVLRAAGGLTGDRARPGPAVGHIFNLGHGILPQTPPDHARVLVDSVREFSEVQP